MQFLHQNVRETKNCGLQNCNQMQCVKRNYLLHSLCPALRLLSGFLVTQAQSHGIARLLENYPNNPSPWTQPQSEDPLPILALPIRLLIKAYQLKALFFCFIIQTSVLSKAFVKSLPAAHQWETFPISHALSLPCKNCNRLPQLANTNKSRNNISIALNALQGDFQADHIMSSLRL